MRQSAGMLGILIGGPLSHRCWCNSLLLHCTIESYCPSPNASPSAILSDMADITTIIVFQPVVPHTGVQTGNIQHLTGVTKGKNERPGMESGKYCDDTLLLLTGSQKDIILGGSSGMLYLLGHVRIVSGSTLRHFCVSESLHVLRQIDSEHHVRVD